LKEVVLSKLDSEYFDEDEGYNEDESSIWTKGAYAKSISMNDKDMKEKMKYFGGDLDNKKEHNCKKCNIQIGKHNLYWHEGMCDDCFSKMVEEGIED
jgi:hypothetical protein